MNRLFIALAMILVFSNKASANMDDANRENNGATVEAKIMSKSLTHVDGQKIVNGSEGKSEGNPFDPATRGKDYVEFSVWMYPNACAHVKHEGFFLKKHKEAGKKTIYVLQTLTSQGLLAVPCPAIGIAPQQRNVKIPLQDIAYGDRVIQIEYEEVVALKEKMNGSMFVWTRIQKKGQRATCIAKAKSGLYETVKCAN